MNIRAVLQLISINYKNFFRESGAIFWSFVFPIAMAGVLGIAFSNKPEKNVKIFVLNSSSSFVKQKTNGNQTLTLGKEIGSTTRCEFIYADSNNIKRGLQKGEASIYIEEKKGKLIYHYDPSNPEAVNTFLILEREFNKTSSSLATVEEITTPGNRYIDFLIPGLIAMGIMNSCIWGVGWYLIEFRMKKLLRRMVATPMKKSDFLFSHVVARFSLCVFESMILLFFSWLFFSIEITGSIAALILVYFSGIAAFGGMGVLVGSRTQSTHVGNGLINAVVLPMTIVSGIFFSYQSFPQWVIPYIKLLPLTLLTDSVRSIFIEGAGLADVILPSGLLLAIGAGCYFAALRIFKWH